MSNTSNGLVDNWLRHVKDVYDRHRKDLDAITDADARLKRFCELNVIEQVRNVCNTETVQSAWRRNQPLAIHGWVYDIHDGLLRDLQPPVTAPAG
jgi:carbonic anhydrase